MRVNIKEHKGVWTLGYSLDKHTISSTPIGPNAQGHMQFDTVRTEAGEAVYQLKYRHDFSQIPIISQQMYESFSSVFSSAGLVIPMPASNIRNPQPVTETAKELARLMGIPCFENILVKTKTTPPMKDIETKEEKVSTLMDAFTVYDVIANGTHDVLLILKFRSSIGVENIL